MQGHLDFVSTIDDMVISQDVATFGINYDAGTRTANLAGSSEPVATHLRDLDVYNSGRRRFDQWRKTGNSLSANAGGQCGVCTQRRKGEQETRPDHSGFGHHKLSLNIPLPMYLRFVLSH
jgi:hypothetical protein